MNKYPGLCIGGPLDGQLVEQSSPSFEVIITGLMSMLPFTYTHAPTEYGIHFWLFDGETPESVLTKLALAYTNRGQ